MKAFPKNIYDSTKPDGYHDGMDLRDYFAAKALVAIGCFEDNSKGIAKLAKDAYKLADAMMKAREQ